MTQDRLTALDAAFLQVEDETAHMHVGGVLVFEGDAPSYDELVASIDERLDLLPRYRQRLAWPAAGLLRPCWVDDPRFDLRYHVGHHGLPGPASDGELRDLAGRLFGEPLDRDRPLWEMHLVDRVGLRRFAIVAKIHHALADGISGVDIATLLLDADPRGRPSVRTRTPERQVPPPPSTAQLAARAASAQASDLADAARGVARTVMRPGEAAAALARTARGTGRLLESAGAGAPPSPYNGSLGRDRRFAWTRVPLDEIAEARERHAVTLNDVALGAVTGALRAHLRTRGHLVRPGLELKAMVPVSVRTDDERGALGNRISSIYAPLPVGVADPVARVRRCHEGVRELREAGQDAGAEAIAAAGDLAPPALMAPVARQMASGRLFNLTVTNIPGPPVALYLLGRRMRDVFPLVPLASAHRLGIALMSYDGVLDVGLVGCGDAMDDLDELALHVRASFRELVTAGRPARSRKPERWSRHAPSEPAPHPDPPRRRDGDRHPAGSGV
jgi:WS/DGAT/MGAT family acyltransferase